MSKPLTIATYAVLGIPGILGLYETYDRYGANFAFPYGTFFFVSANSILGVLTHGESPLL